MSLAEQIRRMRRVPGFELTADWGFVAQWEGSVRPLRQTYRLRMSYCLRDCFAGLALWEGVPVTWLLNPPLRTCCAYAPDEQVPHIYPHPVDLTQSALCFFDPATSEWSEDKVIADHIVPWAIDWLTAYEGWLATGEWTAGGREH
jgi:hypothetical protein